LATPLVDEDQIEFGVVDLNHGQGKVGARKLARHGVEGLSSPSTVTRLEPVPLAEARDTLAHGVLVRRFQPRRSAAPDHLFPGLARREPLGGQVHLLDGHLGQRFHLGLEPALPTTAVLLVRQQRRGLAFQLKTLDPAIKGRRMHPGLARAGPHALARTLSRAQQGPDEGQPALRFLPILIGHRC
jgi:hypothetical protein